MKNLFLTIFIFTFTSLNCFGQALTSVTVPNLKADTSYVEGYRNGKREVYKVTDIANNHNNGILRNGNSYGAALTIGTNDAQNFLFETNGAYVGGFINATGNFLTNKNISIGSNYDPPATTTYNHLFFTPTGRSAIAGAGDGTLFLTSNAYFNAAWKYAASGATTNRLYFNGLGDLVFDFAASGTAGNNISYSTKMLLKNSGSVTFGSGIQVTSGDGVVNATDGFRINNAATSGQYLRGNGTNFVSSAIQAGDIPSLSSLYLPITGGTLTGHLLFTDNTYDIGASGATRPRTGYFGTSLVTPTVASGGNRPLHFNTNGTRRFSIPSSGIANTPSSTKALVLSPDDSLGYTTLQSSDWTNTVTQSGSDTLLNAAAGYGHFQRIGNIVSFTLRVEIALTSAGDANTVYIDPPIASNFTTAASDVIGTATMDPQTLSGANTQRQRCLVFASDSDDKIGVSFDPVASLTYPENRMYISVSGSYVIQ